MFLQNNTTLVHLHFNLSSRVSSSPAWAYIGLGVVPIWILFGNLMVLLAVIRQKNLRTLSNLVIASLAVTDFLLAIFVVPLNAYQLIRGSWSLGLWSCILWTCMDVFLSTTSIMHLCAIAIHRYLAIAYPLRVRNHQTKCHVIALLVPAWLISVAISTPQLWQGLMHNSNVLQEIVKDQGLQCGIFDKSFTIYSSIVSFFLPLAVMVFADIRSVQILRKSSKVTLDPALASMCDANRNPDIVDNDVSIEERRNENGNRHPERPSLSPSKRTRPSIGPSDSEIIQLSSPTSPISETACSINSSSSRSRSSSVYVTVLSARGLIKVNSREKRAEKTLIWVFVCFVVLWLPFFFTNITYGICSVCNIPSQVFLCFTWLGYISSGVNPCIYAFLNKDFRDAFISILLCRPPAKYSYRGLHRPNQSCITSPQADMSIGS